MIKPRALIWKKRGTKTKICKNYQWLSLHTDFCIYY